MSARHERIHWEAPRGSRDVVSASMCGRFAVPVTDDLSRVTCKVCRVRAARGSAPAEVSPLRDALGGGPFANAMHLALSALPPGYGQPTAGAPPTMTPYMWAASCKGAEDGRCRRAECELCTWQTEADRWHALRPWNEVAEKPTNPGVRWHSVAAALVSLARYRGSDQSRLRSATGAQLTRLAMGLSNLTPASDHTIRSHGYDDVVHVEQALVKAYRDGHGGLDRQDAITVLLARTPGLEAEVTPYETLAPRYGLSVGSLRAIVKHGRAVLLEELVGRGLLSIEGARAPVRATASTMRVADEGDGGFRAPRENSDTAEESGEAAQ